MRKSNNLVQLFYHSGAKSFESQINATTHVAESTREKTDNLIDTLWESAKVVNEISVSQELAGIYILKPKLVILNEVFTTINKLLLTIIDDNYKNKWINLKCRCATTP